MTHPAWGEQAGPAAGGPPPPYPAVRHDAPVGLAVASGVLAICFTVVQLCLLLTSFAAASEFEDALRDGQRSGDVLTLYDFVPLALVAVGLPMYVVGCLWLQSARANAEAISPGAHHARGKVWVWLGWWVPIVSFWFPFQVVRDVQEASRPSGTPLGLGSWWAGWTVWVLMNRVTSNIASSTDPDVVSTLPTAEAISSAALLLACAQWCRLLHRITSDQQRALTAPAY